MLLSCATVAAKLCLLVLLMPTGSDTIAMLAAVMLTVSSDNSRLSSVVSTCHTSVRVKIRS